jgi:hypothetical protein
MAKPRKIECLKPEPFYSDLKLYKRRGRCRCFKLTCVEVAALCCRKAAPARRCRLQLGVAAPSIDLTPPHRQHRCRSELGEGDEERRQHAIDARVE